MNRLLALIAAAALCATGSCAKPARPPQGAPAPRVARIAPASAAPVDSDPLGPRPVPSPPAPFQPPVPQVLAGPGQLPIWLFERHDLPIVNIAIVVPYGSGADPQRKGGLAHVAASMMTEGAGDRDALAFSSALTDIGAQLTASADRDATTVRLEVLTSRLDAALGLLADTILRPRHSKRDWQRVRSLWVNGIKARAHDPAEVARVVTAFSFYGDEHPYAHPPDGTVASASKIALGDVIAWHKAIFRPDAATMVVVGDVTRDEILWRIASAFAEWKAPDAPRPPIVAAPPAAAASPKTVLVDRPEAPQVVLSIAAAGVAANAADDPRLQMLNLLLGGSYTSRLNQNLREDHGWTYGVRSGFETHRIAGMFSVRTSVRSDAATDALRETRKEIARMRTGEVSTAELDKLRALVHGHALEDYGTLHGALGRLVSAIELGLGPDRDARRLESQLGATGRDLAGVAPRYFDLSGATIVLVGPRALALDALSANGLPQPEERDAEGNRLRASR